MTDDTDMTPEDFERAIADAEPAEVRNLATRAVRVVETGTSSITIYDSVVFPRQA